MLRTLASEADRAQILSRLHALDAQDAALWGTMSAGEMVCHLRGAFLLAVGDLPVAPVPMRVPRPVFKFCALRVPMRWPPGVATVQELERGRVTPPGLFEQDLHTMFAALERFLATSGNRTPHPIFGTMTPSDWMRWGYLHTDHHLRQFSR